MRYTPLPASRSRPSLVLRRAVTNTPKSPRGSGTTTCYRSTATLVVSHDLGGSGYASVSDVLQSEPDRVHTVSGSRPQVSLLRSSPTSGAGLPRFAASSASWGGMVRRHPRCVYSLRRIHRFRSGPPSLGLPASPPLLRRFDPGSHRHHPTLLDLEALFRGDDRARARHCCRVSRTLSFHGLLFPLPDQLPVVLWTVPVAERSPPSRDGGRHPSG